MRTSGFAGRVRGASRCRNALLLAPLMLCAPGPSTGAPAEAAAAVPTCQGVPATIVGTDRNDKLVGTAGDDVIVGGDGSDDIFGGRGDDLICGGPTKRRTIFGDPVFQSLSGGPGVDTVAGGRGPDEVFGGDGDDVLIGKSGRDGIGGGDGQDSIRGGPDGDNLVGNGADDQLFGEQGGDFIFDENGANTLMGGKGRDFILSGPGNETINGGSGRDLASYAETLHRFGSASHCHDITVDLSQGTSSGIGFGNDLLQGVESVSTGGGDDVLIGDDRPNRLNAGTPCFRNSSESVTGNGGIDRVLFRDPLGDSSSGRVSVDLQNNTARLGNQGASPVLYTLDSVENVTGTEFRDVILGDAGPNLLDAGAFSSGDVIKGRGGNDELTGKFAADRLVGGSGDDILLGNGGADHLDGGSGRNRNDGGNGLDTCLRPSRGALAVNCER